MKETSYTTPQGKYKGALSYRVHLSLPSPLIPFKLLRKQDLFLEKSKRNITRQQIKSIDIVGKEEASCIMIDDPEQLYITDCFISTHNTCLSSYIGGEVQRKRTDGHNAVVFVDFERTFETTFAEKLGLQTDPDHFIFLRPENGEEAFEICQELLRTNTIGLVIWDSDTTTPSAAQMNDEYGKACVSPDTEVNFRIVV